MAAVAPFAVQLCTISGQVITTLELHPDEASKVGLGFRLLPEDGRCLPQQVGLHAGSIVLPVLFILRLRQNEACGCREAISTSLGSGIIGTFKEGTPYYTILTV